MIEIGEKAPEFALPQAGGGAVSLAAIAPKAAVLYFYPRDDTPGCTVEALDFTARRDDFARANAVILGISKDPIADHDRFIAKHNLGIALLSDADSDVCERYGTWVEKNLYGRSSMGIERSTFLIDGQGRIARVWRKVKVEGHVDEVLAAAQAL